MSSLDSSISTLDPTSPSAITIPTSDESSSIKSWFVLVVSGFNTFDEVVQRKVLCLVDPQEPVASAARKLETLLFDSFGRKRSECELGYVCPESPNDEYRPRSTFNASVEHLVVHLREFGTTPGARPVEPELWGGGHNRFVANFKKK